MRSSCSIEPLARLDNIIACATRPWLLVEGARRTLEDARGLVALRMHYSRTAHQ